jgi:hypothetical protein
MSLRPRLVLPSRFRHAAVIPAAALLAGMSILSGCARPVPHPSPNLSAYGAIAVLPFRTEGFLERYGSEVADQVVIELLQREPGLRIVSVPATAVSDTAGERGGETGGGDREARLTAAALTSGATLVVTGSCVVRMDWVRRAWTSRQAYATATVRAIDPRDNRVVWAGRETATVESQAYGAAGDTLGLRIESSDPELREQAIVRLAGRVAARLIGK